MDWMRRQGRAIRKFKSISDLPFEAHIPGYQYCGPGTDFNGRSAKGQNGINKLDALCKSHDTVYNDTAVKNDTNKRRRLDSDRVLIDNAKLLRKDKSASWHEKLATYAVEGGMTAKNRLGIY